MPYRARTCYVLFAFLLFDPSKERTFIYLIIIITVTAYYLTLELRPSYDNRNDTAIKTQTNTVTVSTIHCLL